MRGKFFAAALVAIAAAPLASAHRVGVPVTEITPNPRTGLWEVVHRLALHDLESQLISEGLTMSEALEGTGSKTAMVERIARQFSLEGLSEPISLDFVGFETEGDYLWVYFEFESADQAIEISNTLLFEGNTATGHALVNIRDGEGDVTSARFAQSDSRKSLELCFVTCSISD